MNSDKETGEALRETMILQLLEGLRSAPMMLLRARDLAKRDPNMAEALRRYDQENSK